ncbi:MAG: hypothetical protein DI617_09095, partial [Streptococcus pyogenes]
IGSGTGTSGKNFAIAVPALAPARVLWMFGEYVGAGVGSNQFFPASDPCCKLEIKNAKLNGIRIIII